MLEKCVQLFGTEGRAFFNGDFSVAIPSRKSVRLVAGWKERRKRFWRSFCMVDLPMRYFANGSPFVALAARTSTRTMSYHAWFRVSNGECFLYFLTISHLLAVLAFIDDVGRFYVCVWRTIRHKLILQSFISRLFITYFNRSFIIVWILGI